MLCKWSYFIEKELAILRFRMVTKIISLIHWSLSKSRAPILSGQSHINYLYAFLAMTSSPGAFSTPWRRGEKKYYDVSPSIERGNRSGITFYTIALPILRKYSRNFQKSKRIELMGVVYTRFFKNQIPFTMDQLLEVIMIIRLIHAKVRAGKQDQFRQILELVALPEIQAKNGMIVSSQ